MVGQVEDSLYFKLCTLNLCINIGIIKIYIKW